MKSIRPSLLLAALVVLTGCQTGLPSVQYRQACSPVTNDRCESKMQSLAKFNLPKSLIVLAAKDDKVPVYEQELTGAVAPAEWQGVMLEMLKDDPWGRESTINVTRRESTNLLQAVNASVKDNRPELVEKWGALAVKLVAAGVTIAAVCEPGVKHCPPPKEPDLYFPLPLVIDTAPLLAEVAAGGGPVKGEVASKTEPATKVGFTLEAGPLPQDAIPVQDYLTWAVGKRTHEIVSSVCRTVSVRFDRKAYAPLGGTAWTFQVADPHYVQTISFPSGGSMTAQPVCGFNVSNTAAEVDKTTEILGASLTQIIAIAEAWTTKADATKGGDKAK